MSINIYNFMLKWTSRNKGLVDKIRCKLKKLNIVLIISRKNCQLKLKQKLPKIFTSTFQEDLGT